MNPGRLVVIDENNFVDGETPLEDFSPFFTIPVLMDEVTADEVFMGILEALDDGRDVDVQAIFDWIVLRRG